MGETRAFDATFDERFGFARRIKGDFIAFFGDEAKIIDVLSIPGLIEERDLKPEIFGIDDRDEPRLDFEGFVALELSGERQKKRHANRADGGQNDGKDCGPGPAKQHHTGHYYSENALYVNERKHFLSPRVGDNLFLCFLISSKCFVWAS